MLAAVKIAVRLLSGLPADLSLARATRQNRHARHLLIISAATQTQPNHLSRDLNHLRLDALLLLHAKVVDLLLVTQIDQHVEFLLHLLFLFLDGVVLGRLRKETGNKLPQLGIPAGLTDNRCEDIEHLDRGTLFIAVFHRIDLLVLHFEHLERRAILLKVVIHLLLHPENLHNSLRLGRQSRVVVAKQLELAIVKPLLRLLLVNLLGRFRDRHEWLLPLHTGKQPRGLHCFCCQSVVNQVVFVCEILVCQTCAIQHIAVECLCHVSGESGTAKCHSFAKRRLFELFLLTSPRRAHIYFESF
mmetsp:Transcript_40433/g.117806  ORF Transcript_40433/g.117806 Transcript_40433/m.117806 type:complete len:301 (+) Transcript_40433:296-1198(+)